MNNLNTNQNNKTAYQSILKATTIFGGVQLYHILISIVKSKVIAVLLGPAGVGIMSLFQSSIDLFRNLTSMGLSQSAVRDVSEANGKGDELNISKIVHVVRKLVWGTGIFGTIVVAVCSPFLSKFSFGNYDYTISFVFLSITLLVDQLSAGQKVILQGLRKLKDLAKASAIGATFGLVISIPLYYVLGVRGIVPTLILHSLASLLISWLYSKRIKILPMVVDNRTTLSSGKQMLIMGIAMSISSIFATLIGYLLRGYIRGCAGIDEVGLYQAGFAILTTYVGLVFSAIATDYYPRLAAVNKDNEKISLTVGQQGEIATMILSPMLCACIVYMPIVLRVLYSDKFLGATNYITIACFGMMFKLAAWLVSFIFVAKAESKLFIVNEVTAKIYMLLLGIVGYKFWGLTGLGFAFVLQYFLYFIQVYIIAHYKYGFTYASDFKIVFIRQFILVAICLLCVFVLHGVLKYICGSLVILYTLYYSLKELNRKLDLITLIKSKI